MIRSRLSSRSLPLFLLAAVVVSITAFGLTRWVMAPGETALPALALAGDTAAAAPGALDPAKLYAARIDTVVSITSTIAGGTTNGAGVVVDAENGTIVTASHVIKDYDKAAVATMIAVRFQQGDEVLATLEAIDQFNDLAILKVDPAELDGLSAAELGDSDQVITGAPVAAIGAPFGYSDSQTLGNVSYAHRVLESRINRSWKIPDAIQFDASVNTGNSGGPLFNARGQVIGINQQIATPSKTNSGVSFAVSSNIVARALRIWRETGARSIPYADLGLATVTLSPQVAAAGQISVTRGAMVQRAVGPAATAGLATGQTIEHLGRTVVLGDVIVGLAGREIRTSDDLVRVAAAIDADAPVELEFVRGGERRQVTVDPVPRAIS